MRERLPTYVVNCLMAAGFDSVDVISSMNVTDEPNNSIEVIETFIDKYFRGNEEYYSNPELASRPFVFPPGHRIRIANFVSEVSKPKLKQPVSCTLSSYRPSKVPRTDKEVQPEQEQSMSSVTSQIRSNISRWIKAQSSGQLRRLKENEHFQVIVSSTSGSMSAIIRYNACNKDICLHRKNSYYLISNWTRHAKVCKKIIAKEGDSQKTLGIFYEYYEKSMPRYKFTHQ